MNKSRLKTYVLQGSVTSVAQGTLVFSEWLQHFLNIWNSVVVILDTMAEDKWA